MKRVLSGYCLWIPERRDCARVSCRPIGLPRAQREHGQETGNRPGLRGSGLSFARILESEKALLLSQNQELAMETENIQASWLKWGLSLGGNCPRRQTSGPAGKGTSGKCLELLAMTGPPQTRECTDQGCPLTGGESTQGTLFLPSKCYPPTPEAAGWCPRVRRGVGAYDRKGSIPSCVCSGHLRQTTVLFLTSRLRGPVQFNQHMPPCPVHVQSWRDRYVHLETPASAKLFPGSLALPDLCCLSNPRATFFQALLLLLQLMTDHDVHFLSLQWCGLLGR